MTLDGIGWKLIFECELLSEMIGSIIPELLNPLNLKWIIKLQPGVDCVETKQSSVKCPVKPGGQMLHSGSNIVINAIFIIEKIEIFVTDSPIDLHDAIIIGHQDACCVINRYLCFPIDM